MKYFSECKTIDDVKQTFHKYAKQLHPDAGGDAAEFRAMFEEYETAFNCLKNTHAKADGTTYTKETTETPEEFAEIINAIIHLDGIKIEIIGAWVWVSGNTYPHRETIKESGFTWSKTKKSWYHTGSAPDGIRRRGRYSMDTLRAKWGVMEVETEEQRKIA